MKAKLVKENLTGYYYPEKNIDDINIDPNDDLVNLLYLAIEKTGSLDLVNKLIAIGVNPNGYDKGNTPPYALEYTSPIESALINGRQDIAVTLLNAGATLDLELIQGIMTHHYRNFMKAYNDKGYDIREIRE